MLSSNACVSALIEKRSSTFSYPSNWASLVRKDARRDTGLLDAFARQKPYPCAEKKRGWTRRRGSNDPWFRSNRLAVFARARGVFSLEEGLYVFPGKVCAFSRVVLRKKTSKKVNFVAEKAETAQIFIQFSTLFSCGVFFSRERT